MPFCLLVAPVARFCLHCVPSHSRASSDRMRNILVMVKFDWLRCSRPHCADLILTNCRHCCYRRKQSVEDWTASCLLGGGPAWRVAAVRACGARAAAAASPCCFLASFAAFITLLNVGGHNCHVCNVFCRRTSCDVFGTTADVLEEGPFFCGTVSWVLEKTV